MDKALIEKADELKEQFIERNKDVQLPHPIMLDSMADGYSMGIIDGATWQREQLISELREWIDKEHKDTVGNTGCYYCIPAQDLTAKLDLLSSDLDKESK
jgi:hypothetical protein